MIKYRFPFMLLGLINMVAGLLTGLVRIGWNIELPMSAVHHGALMVGGFVTTLIALEKAIPLKSRTSLVVPVISGVSALVVWPPLHSVGMGCLITASAGLLCIQSLYLYRFPRDPAMLLMCIGAACLVAGNAMLVSTSFYPSAFPWWIGFLLFTIVGERLELSRFLPVPAWAKRLLLIMGALFLVGLLLPFHTTGRIISGIAMVGIAVWLLRFDVIRIGLRSNDLPKYSATALLLANLWLIVDGLFLIVLPDSAFAYDSLVHTFFIGFALSMIFAHGPIILPSVLGFSFKPFHPVLYLWLGILQLSLIMRIAGNAMVGIELRRYGGVFTLFAVLCFFITLAMLTLATLRARRLSEGS